jgi:transcriptional regulator GlxA family with amidase domain
MLKDVRVSQSVDFIRMNFDRRLSVMEIARHVGLSLKHFERLFKKQTGLSPKAHLRLTRIEKAKELLADTTLKVTAIAFEVGYSDLRHFERDFRKATGTVPKQYRNENRTAESVISDP